MINRVQIKALMVLTGLIVANGAIQACQHQSGVLRVPVGQEWMNTTVPVDINNGHKEVYIYSWQMTFDTRHYLEGLVAKGVLGRITDKAIFCILEATASLKTTGTTSVSPAVFSEFYAAQNIQGAQARAALDHRMVSIILEKVDHIRGQSICTGFLHTLEPSTVYTNLANIPVIHSIYQQMCEAISW
ncbi:MAG: hypothetical protein LBJ77_00360 [Holosporales bacterium]|jgi:hypothetical protein|nr:hypothetical protein [Holosporales bacterium]